MKGTPSTLLLPKMSHSQTSTFSVISAESSSSLLGKSSLVKSASTGTSFLLPSASVRLDFHRYSTPVSGPMGRKNLKQVASGFKFQRYIEGVENRSVTTAQLVQVQQYALGHCHSWELEMSALTTHDIVEWVVRPATKEKNSSLMEHLTNKALLPSFFVSHSWGVLVDKFIKCVREHSAVRGLSGQTGYWVCAYAWRPHGQLPDIPANPKDSSLFIAMQASQFKVLLVLDSTSIAEMPMTRTWCAFECAMCLHKTMPAFDVAAVLSNDVEVGVITSGFTSIETRMERWLPGSGIAAKAKREETFPLDVLRAILQFNVLKTQTQADNDRRRILNCMAGRSLDLEPLTADDSYHQVTRRLRSLFGLVFWQRALSEDLPAEKGRLAAHLTVLGDLAKAIAGDWWRKSLCLCLSGCSLQHPELAELMMNGLPEKLESLKLDLSCSGLSGPSLHMFARSLPATLQSCSIDCSGCEGITDADVLAFLEDLLGPSLKTLNLGLSRTRVSRGLQKINDKGLGALREWQKMPPALQAQTVKELEDEREITRAQALLAGRRQALEILGSIGLPGDFGGSGSDCCMSAYGLEN
eukprot:TRINITY_DN14997_c0_g1_i5.p1 TRINITY_DN14997_c0_g1~~TRINITY_DN14997_c0_g1_i5.p1  ORF type:complete len:582 (+),score=102.23 TRINITY_DN14997_c0_g1_i5:92-1837(+)